MVAAVAPRLVPRPDGSPRPQLYVVPGGAPHGPPGAGGPRRDELSRDGLSRDGLSREGLRRDGLRRDGSSPQGRRGRDAAVYRRRRLVLLVVLAGAVVGPWLAVRATADGAAPAPPPGGAAPAPPAGGAPARLWVVRPGDTLWGIAQASGYRGDIRRLVDELSAEVHDQPLLVGERISVP